MKRSSQTAVVALWVAVLHVVSICAFAAISIELTLATQARSRPSIDYRAGHSGSILALAMSSDGKTVASAGRDRTVRLWSVGSGRKLHTLVGHSGAIISVVFSPDLKTIASADHQGQVILWHLATGRILQRLAGAKSDVEQIAFSADGKRLVAGTKDGTIWLWNLHTGAVELTVKAHFDYVQAVAFSPDSKYLVSGSLDKTVKVWNVKQKRLLATFNSAFLCTGKVGFSSDGETIVAADGENRLKGWSLKTHAEISSADISKLPGCSSFHAEGTLVNHLFGPFYKEIAILNGKKIQDYVDCEIPISCFALSPDGKRLITAGTDNVVRVFDPASRQQVQSFSGRSTAIISIAFPPDGKKVIAGCLHDQIRLLEKNSSMRLDVLGDQIRTKGGKYDDSDHYPYRGRYSGSGVAFALSPDGQAIAYENNMRGVSIGLLSTDKILGFVQNNASIQEIKFSPDLKNIALLTSYGHLDLLTVKGKNLHRIEVASIFEKMCLGFSPDGTQLAVGGKENILIDVASGAKKVLPVRSNGFLNALAYSPDGKLLACGFANGTIVICDTNSWRERHRFKAKFACLSSLAFSPDSKLLAIGDELLGLRLWHVGSFTEPFVVARSDKPVAPVYSLAFTPNGKFLAAGSDDCAIKFWNLASKTEAATLYLLEGNQWALVDGAGHFDCSQYGRLLLNTKIKNRYVNLSEAGDGAYRPGLANKLLKIEI